MENLRAGDHAAFFYRTRAEQFAVIVPFMAIGLKRGERRLCIADDNSVETVAGELEGGCECGGRAGAGLRVFRLSSGGIYFRGCMTHALSGWPSMEAVADMAGIYAVRAAVGVFEGAFPARPNRQ